MRIAIVTMADQAMAEVSRLTLPGKAHYAAMHNHDLHVYHRSLDDTRHPAWSYIRAVRRHILDYDWVFWTEPDALITNQLVTLQSFADDAYQIVLSDDLNGINCGNVMWKGGERGAELLDAIWNCDPHWHWHLQWHQDWLNHLIRTNPRIGKEIKHLPWTALQANWQHRDIRPTPFLCHLSGVPNEVRVQMFKAILGEP